MWKKISEGFKDIVFRFEQTSYVDAFLEWFRSLVKLFLIFFAVWFLLSIALIYQWVAPPLESTVLGIHSLLGLIFTRTWWFWLFSLLLPLASDSWQAWKELEYKKGLKWAMFEIMIPREVTQGIRAMEQVLIAFNRHRNDPSLFVDRYVDGEIPRWFSLEMVSFGGEVRFFVRTLVKYRAPFEAAVFSFYPDIEIAQCDDYLDQFPSTIEEFESQGLKVYGCDYQVNKKDYIPLKNYRDFEEQGQDEKDIRQFDPISAFLEFMGRLKPGEIGMVHYLMAPLGGGWGKKFKKDIDKLKEPKIFKVASEESKTGKQQLMIPKTTAENEYIERIEDHITKPAFEGSIRSFYFAPAATFNDDFFRRGMNNAISQFNTVDFNSIRINYGVDTRTHPFYYPHFFPKRRAELRKRRLLWLLRKRDVPPYTLMGKFFTSWPLNLNNTLRFILTSEELATMFHPPTALVLTAPHIKRVESRKAGPPAGLAIFGDEKGLEKFIQ